MTEQNALSKIDWDDMREITLEGVLETSNTLLTLKRPKYDQVYDPEFGHAIPSEADDEYKFHYTQLGSSSLKELDPSNRDFLTIRRHQVYVHTLEVERLLPDKKIHREQDVIVINEVEYVIEAITPYPQQHGASMMQKLQLTTKRPGEQDQGNNGS